MNVHQLHRLATPVELATDNIQFEMHRIRAASGGVLSKEQLQALRIKTIKMKKLVNELEQTIKEQIRGY